MKISIKWALFLVFTLLVISSVGFIMTSSYHTSKNAILKHAKGIMDNVVTFTKDKAISHINVAKDASELTQGLATQKIVNSEDFAGMEEYFLEQLKVHKQFFNIYYGNENGAFLMVSRDSKQEELFYIKQILIKQGIRKVTLKTLNLSTKTAQTKQLNNDTYNPTVRPWYQQSKVNSKTIWTDPYIFFSSKRPGITAASPVVDGDGVFRGSVGVDIIVEELSDLLATLKFTKDGSIVIFDEKTNIIASNNPEALVKVTPDSKKISLSKLEDLKDPILTKAYESFQNQSSLKNFIQLEHEDKTYHVIFSPFSSSDITWIIGIYLSEDSYVGEIKEQQKLNLYIALAIGLIFLIVGYPVANSISKPITNMQLFANELQHHHIDPPKLPPSILKEVDESSKVFYNLKDEIIKFDEENQKLTNNLKNASLDTLYRLAVAAEYKDIDTAEHIKRISESSRIIAQGLGLSEKEIYIIGHASAMHDVGKLGIPDKILLKPGKLDDDEMKIMKTHSEIGAKILENPSSEIMVAARDIALYHHERYDGTGYPYKLKAEEIPLMARIVAVIDVFDALVSKRCYKEALSINKSVDIIEKGRGTHFDPKCVDVFEKQIDNIVKIYKQYSS